MPAARRSPLRAARISRALLSPPSPRPARASRSRRPRSRSPRGRSPRSSRAIRRACASAADLSRRAGADLVVSGVRRHLVDPRAGRRRELPRRHRQGRAGCAGASSTTGRARPASRMPRWRRCSGPTASRWRRAAGTTPNRSPRTAARSGSASSASIASCASTSASMACWRAASRSRCRPASSGCRTTRGSNASSSCRASCRSAARLIAISERGLDADGNIQGFLIGGPSPGEFSVKRIGDFDISDCAVTPAGDLLLLERSFSRLTRRRHAHPPRSARRGEARRDGRRPGAGRSRHGLSDRQHGRAVGASRSRRRARADADLGR